MGEQPGGWDEEVERAWRGLGSALAAHVVDMVEGERWSLWDGVSPRADAAWVELTGAAGGSVRLEAGPVPRPAREGEDADEADEADALVQRRVADLGWRVSPEPPEGNVDPCLEQTLPAGEGDLVAFVVVRLLREVHGCLHPLLLVTDALEGWTPSPAPLGLDESAESDAADGAPRPATAGTTPSREPFYPRHRHELEEALHTALGEVLGHEPVVDDDGDVGITVGRSVLFVRVVAGRPTIEVFAELVLDVVDRDRLRLELDLLNRQHGAAQFHSRDDVVVLRYELPAWPFVPAQMAVVVHELGEIAEQARRDLVERVGGRAFLDPPAETVVPLEVEPVPSTSDRPPVERPALAMVLEMLHAGPVPARCVAEAFERDRHALIATIVAVRQGLAGLDGHDPETVLHLLRVALRLVVDGRAEIGAAPRPPRRRSEQPALIDDAELGEDPLDLDWSV